MGSFGDLHFEMSMLCEESTNYWTDSNLSISVELGKLLLERNRQLEASLAEYYKITEDQNKAIEYMTKKMDALREISYSKLHIYDQLEDSMIDLKRENYKLMVKNTEDMKRIEELEKNCKNLQADSDNLSQLLDEYKRKYQHLASSTARKSLNDTQDPKMSTVDASDRSVSEISDEEAAQWLTELSQIKQTYNSVLQSETDMSGYSTDAESLASVFAEGTKSSTSSRIGTYLCSIVDGRDCMFSVYDDVDQTDSRFGDVTKYYDIVSEIFSVLKKTVEGRENPIPIVMPNFPKEPISNPFFEPPTSQYQEIEFSTEEKSTTVPQTYTPDNDFPLISEPNYSEIPNFTPVTPSTTEDSISSSKFSVTSNIALDKFLQSRIPNLVVPNFSKGSITNPSYESSSMSKIQQSPALVLTSSVKDFPTLDKVTKPSRIYDFFQVTPSTTEDTSSSNISSLTSLTSSMKDFPALDKTTKSFSNFSSVKPTAIDSKIPSIKDFPSLDKSTNTSQKCNITLVTSNYRKKSSTHNNTKDLDDITASTVLPLANKNRSKQRKSKVDCTTNQKKDNGMKSYSTSTNRNTLRNKGKNSEKNTAFQEQQSPSFSYAEALKNAEIKKNCPKGQSHKK